MGKTRPASKYDFPQPLRDFSSKMPVPGFKHLTEAHVPLHFNAAQLIADSVINAAHHHQQVIIISIGTAANLTDAWQYANQHHQQRLFRQGLALIVKGGGAFGDTYNHRISNKHIRGNISIPGIITSNNNSAEWNIYANAPAMQILIHARLPIAFVPNNATDHIQMTKRAYKQLRAHSNPQSPRRFSANAMLSMVKLQGGWNKIANNLDFWDTSVTLATLYPTIIESEYRKVPMDIILQHGPQYAATWTNEKSPYHVNVWYRLNKQLLYKTLFANLY